MSYNRTRSMSWGETVTGSWYVPLSQRWFNRTSTNSGFRDTADTVGNWDGDNPFESIAGGSTHVLISGQRSSGHIFNGVPTYAGDYGAPPHELSDSLGTTEANQLALDAIAKTNINAPVFSLPRWLGELKDLPALVRSLGREHLLMTSQYRSGKAFSKRLADRDLELRFGIFPMVDDLRKIVQTSIVATKRLRWLNRLYAGEAIRRSATLGATSTGRFLSSVLLWSTGTTVNTGGRTIRTTQKTWGSVQWILDRDMTPYTPLDTSDDRREAVVRSVYGLTPQALSLAAWELIPWTWLTDWFLDLGSLIQAVQNSIPVKSSRVNIMRMTDTIERGYPTCSHKELVLTGTWYRWRRTKRRVPVSSPSPFHITLPLLEADCFSILSSLAVQRRRQGHR